MLEVADAVVSVWGAKRVGNASAEQWRHVGSIELLRKRIGEVFSRERIFGIPSVD
jgi:hypothetical protein